VTIFQLIYKGFIIQSTPGNGNQICVSAALTFEFKTRRSYAFIHGIPCKAYDTLINDIPDYGKIETPLLIPVMIIERNLERWVMYLDNLHEQLYDYERTLGIRYGESRPADPRNVDFTKFSQSLNSLTTNLSYAAWACKATARHLDFLDLVITRYGTQAARHGIPQEHLDDVQDIFQDTHAHLRSWNEGIQDRVEYLLKRGQALVQTVSGKSIKEGVR
jgi:hypothetical protein